MAWFHHKGRNPHHWEYWIDNVGTRSNDAARIPYKYVVEMVCDWLAAGITYSKKKPDYNAPYDVPINYFDKHLNERIFHPDTLELLQYFLGEISSKGINSFCKSVRRGNSAWIMDYVLNENNIVKIDSTKEG